MIVTKTIGNRCIYKEVSDDEVQNLEKSKDLNIGSEITLTQRVEALENAVADLSVLSIEE